MHDDAELRQAVSGAVTSPSGAAKALAEMEGRWPYHVLVRAARAVLARPVWSVSGVDRIGLVTGSGGMSRRIPNISTAAAVTASCMAGVRVVKPGSHTSRSKSVGPVGLARRLGLTVATDEQDLEHRLAIDQFALLDTDAMYPWLRCPEVFTVPFFADAVQVSSLMPCTAHWKVNGVVDLDEDLHVERCRGSLVERTMVLRGRTDIPGFVIDDVSTAGTTEILLIQDGLHTRWSVEPEDVGATRVPAETLILPDSLSAEYAFVAILKAQASPALIELVAFSAAMILFHAGAVSTIAEGYARAFGLITSGAAARKLDHLRSWRPKERTRSSGYHTPIATRAPFITSTTKSG